MNLLFVSLSANVNIAILECLLPEKSKATHNFVSLLIIENVWQIFCQTLLFMLFSPLPLCSNHKLWYFIINDVIIILLHYCRISVLVFHFQDWMFHSFLQQLSENTYMYLSGLL